MRKRKVNKVDVHNGFGDWGGYMDAKISKLEEQFTHDALRDSIKESDLFAGISIFVNGLTNPSADELKCIMMKHGGIFHSYRRHSTTFVIATNLPDVKIRQITTTKIISPKWVVDCLKENRILDYSKYLLYTNSKVSQPKIGFKKCETIVEETGAPKQTIRDIEPNENSEDEEQTRNDDLELCLKNAEPIQMESFKEDEVKPAAPIDFIKNLQMLNIAIRNNDKNPGTVIKPDVSASDKTKIEVKKNVARTAVDPNFLTEFYSNSRLHHIATLGASFKGHISKLRESHNGQFPMRDRLKQEFQSNKTCSQEPINSDKSIMHIDMDCFFVSVGLRTRPHLKGFPIAVTHSKGSNTNNLQSLDGVDRKKEMELYVKRHEDRYKVNQSNLDDDEKEIRKKSMPLIDNTISLSEIASCSYEAREMGVKNGMFVGAALKLCPQLKTIPYDFDAYKEVANILYDTITQFTLDVEAVSCDEMYVNLTDVLKILNCSVDEFVTYVRNDISQKTQCPCSAGIGENKLQARMATRKAKPNGQFHLLPDNVEDYFRNISISDLPGVGYSTTLKLNNLHVKTCADLQQIALNKLQQDFGKKLGETLHQYCRGIDNKPLTYDQVRKSVSAEVNYGIRFTEDHELDTFLEQLCNEVHNRLNEISAKGKTITLKYMVRAQDAPVETAKFMGHGFCDNVTKSTTLSTSTCDLEIIKKTIFNIKTVLNVPPKELRGIGIQISKLDARPTENHKSNRLKSLFEKAEAKQKHEKQSNHSFDRMPVLPDLNVVNRSTEKRNSLRKIKSFGGTPTRGFKSNLKSTISTESLHKIYEELDLNVLAELPDDIREEVLQEQNRILNVNQHNTKSTNDLFQASTTTTTTKKFRARKLEDDFMDEDLKDGNLEEKVELAKRPIITISDDNILSTDSWRQILTQWLDGNTEPVECDINIIGKYFEEYAAANKLPEVLLALRFMHRKTESMNCHWHRVYYKLNNVVQRQVKVLFGTNFKLFIEENFKCKNCTNRIDFYSR